MRMSAIAISLYVAFICPSTACDPIGSLRGIGIKIEGTPEVVEEPNNKYPGDFTLGIIHVRSLDDCFTLLHEYVHYWQYQKWGSADDYNEWWRREMQADQLAKKALRND